MALLITKKTDTGLLVENTYSRIDNISISRNRMTITLNYYKDKDFLPFAWSTYGCRYTTDGENPFKQAYDYLKTLDEFKDSEDC